jgi:hypothetical protein
MQQSVYDPGFLTYGGGAASTVLHPVVAVAMCIAVVCLLVLPRKYAMAAFLFVVLMTPTGQQLYIGGVHIFVHRILIVVGLIRVAWSKFSAKGEICAGGVTRIDKVFFCWALFHATASVLLNNVSSGAVVYEVGFLWDALGGYFLLRFFIQDQESVEFVVKTFAWIVVVVSATMVYEKFHNVNIFGYFGSVSLQPDVREGAIRSRGPFAHAILAGVFGATVLPLFLWLWQSKAARSTAVAGIAGSTIMVLTSASSTPLLAYLSVILGCCFWVLRKQMRIFRWGIVIALVALQLVMKAPVWFLINHVDIVPGNSSYHRAMLVDMFIRHFSDWWLVGTNDARNWGWDMWDTSNQFVGEGENGGLATFVCFVLIISWSFGLIGKARKRIEGDRNKEWLLWFLGVALLSNVISYFGVSYFDQTKFMWFSLLAIISVVTSSVLGVPGSSEVTEGAEWDARSAPEFPHPSPQSPGSFAYEPRRQLRPQPSQSRQPVAQGSNHHRHSILNRKT